MRSHDRTAVRKRRKWLALVCLAGTAVLLPAGAMAKDTRTCTPGTTLRLSAPESSQGRLLLIEVESAKPLVEVQGDWDGRSVPFWREVASEAQRKGLLGVDLEKEPGEYELKITGQLASGGKISCTARVTVRKGRFATEKLQVGKQFVEPSPEQIKRADEEREKLRDIFEHVTPERLWDGKFRIPLDGVTTGSNFGRRRILNGNPGSPHGGADLPGDYFLVGIPWWWITAWGFTRFMDIYQRSTLRWETRWKPGPCWEKWERRGESRDRTCIGGLRWSGRG